MRLTTAILTLFLFSTTTAHSQCQLDTLLASNGQAGDQFGFTLDMDMHVAVVGAHMADTVGVDSGAAYVYRRVDDLWVVILINPKTGLGIYVVLGGQIFSSPSVLVGRSGRSSPHPPPAPRGAGAHLLGGGGQSE